MQAAFKPPTREELIRIIGDIKKQFPHEASPHNNPGKGLTILAWMEENFGPLDGRWTIIDEGVVRFKDVEDKLAFVLAWGADFEEAG